MRPILFNPSRRALYGLRESLNHAAGREIWRWYSEQIYGTESVSRSARDTLRLRHGENSSAIHARKAFDNHVECLLAEISQPAPLHTPLDAQVRAPGQAKTTKAACPVPRNEEASSRGLPLPSHGAGVPAGMNLRRANRHGEKHPQDSTAQEGEQKALLRRQPVVSAHDD